MRILFSSVPAFGHLLPLIPLARAGRDSGHDVAVMTSAGMAVAVETEMPGITFLPAGPMPEDLFAEVARRVPAHDPLGVPDPGSVAEFFAGARVDLGIEEALHVVESWKPDVIVSEAVDFVGPLAAATAGIPSAAVAFGPALPEAFSQPMFAVATPRYAARGLTQQPPIALIDPAPERLQAPGWTSNPLLIPVRAEPHTRGTRSEPMPPFTTSEGLTRILVTLGTVFGDDTLLSTIIESIPQGSAIVIATVGVSPAATQPPDTEHVHYERFRPMAELLEGVDVVVSVGGAGTVLAALSRGIPLVLIPQGADQFINAERAAYGGAAIVVQRPEEVGDAVGRVISTPSFRDAAETIRAANDSRPSAASAIAALAERVEASRSRATAS